MQKTDVTDTLQLQKLADGSLKFEFSLIRTNGHSCELMGVAEDKGNYFEYTEKIELGGYAANCVLRIRIDDSTILFEDTNRDCRLAYCGMRAGIDGATFPR